MLSHVQLFLTLWTVARQAPLSMEFSRQECWSSLPFPPAGDLPNPGMEPTSPESPSLAGGFFTAEPPRKSDLHVGRCLSHFFSAEVKSKLHAQWHGKCFKTHLCQSSEPTRVTFHTLGNPHPGTGGQAWSHIMMAEDQKEEEILAKVFFLPT